MVTGPKIPPLPRGEIALFLDIDGTLLEHRAHPDAVVVDVELRNLLIATEERLDGAIALITGRSVRTVDRLFAPLALPVAGLYGLEHRLTRGGKAELAREPEDMAAVAEALQSELHGTDGVYFERKGPVLAIHTRAAPHALERVKAAAKSVLARLPAGYRIVAGNAGLEFLPIEALKSGAIHRFMEIGPFTGRTPVFIGDDVSDECGFDYVNQAGGLSIRVRPAGETAAAHTLNNVAAVRKWIADTILTGETSSSQRNTGLRPDIIGLS
jgi:trehalose 6-phosphate phosphatase